MTTATTDHTTTLADKLQQIEQQLNRLQDQLIRAQRLAVIGTMSSMTAHEFNNLLTPIVSYAQYALKQNDPELWKKALQRAYESGDKASSVAQQLLGFARGSATATTADVKEVVENTLTCLARDLSKDNIELTLDLSENAFAAIQPHLLQQVLYNLIINSRQAMIGKPGYLSILATLENGMVRIVAKDTGPGIEPQVLEKIFDAFYTTKTDADRADLQGSGLGLPISRQIIEEVGGSISAASEVGRGTTFTIVLPSVN